MKDLQSLLRQINEVNRVQTYSDLVRLNAPEEVKAKLKHLEIDPSANEEHDFVDRIGLERIIGKNNLMDISYLYKGIKIAQTLCRIIYFKNGQKIPSGTGFLVGPGIIMTNNHVVPDTTTAKHYYAEFEYENNESGKLKPSFIFSLDANRFFITNSDLDYTVIGVSGIAQNDPQKKLESYGYNILKKPSSPIIIGEAVSIVQHPQGLPKMIALRENKVVKIDATELYYTTDTMEGSSGSFVANDEWEIIALHKQGVPKKNENGDILLVDGDIYIDDSQKHLIQWIANKGTLISCILGDISDKKVGNETLSLKQELLKGFTSKNIDEPFVLSK